MPTVVISSMDGAPLIRLDSDHHGTPRPHVSAVHTITVDTVRRGLRGDRGIEHAGGGVEELPCLSAGVGCGIGQIMEGGHRGLQGRETDYVRGSAQEPVPPAVAAWEREVHAPGIYDMEVDTTNASPEACAAAIRRSLD